MAELKPCPLCGGAMNVRTNRDWHRLVGEHTEDCLMQDFEPYYSATPKDREAIVAAWNRRVTPGVAFGEPPSLSEINELAKVYASSYASPHHITFTVDGLRNFVDALAGGGLGDKPSGKPVTGD